MKSARPGFLLVCLVAPLVAVKLREVKSEHPIQRVIRLVEELASKSVEEGKEEQLTYDKFVAWCEKSSKSLNKAIEKETEVSEKTSGKIEAKTLEKEQLTESIEALTKELSELEASATAAADDRAEQKKQHEQSVKDLKMTIESLGTAVTSLEASQVNQDVALLSKVMQIPLVLVALSQEEQALLEEAAAPKDYDFKTGGVTELLEKLKLDFEDKLSSAEKDGAKATQEYELAKGARDNAMKVAIESKTKQEEVKAAVVSELSELDAKLTSTEKDLEEDTKSLSDTKTTCDTKAAEFKERVYMRGREQEAMKFGIQILQKATGVRTAKPASFIQIRSHGTFGTSAAQKAQALRLLQREVERSNNEDLRRLLLEVQSRLEGDGDVGKEVDAMLEKQLWKMRENQTTEDEKWQWCVAETKKTKKQKTNKEDDMEKLTNGIQSAQGSVTELQGEIKEATKRLSDLQKSSNEFKMDRQESKNEHQLALRDAKLAQEALSGAIGTLNKFYEEAAASLLQSVKPTDVAEAPETWSKGFSGTGQDGKGPGEAIIKVLEDCSADFAQMEAETKSQEVQEEADFDKEMIDAKKEKVRLQTEKSSKEEEEARLSEKIRDMSEKKKMTDRSVALLAKYHEDLSQKCNQTAYEARTAERKVSKVELQKSQALLKEAFDASAETMLLRSKAHLSVLSSGSLAHRLGAAKRGSREAVSALHVWTSGDSINDLPMAGFFSVQRCEAAGT